MANNYCQFSTAIEYITAEEQEWAEAELTRLADLNEDNDGNLEFGHEFDVDDHVSLYLNSGNESGNPSAVVNFVQSFIRKFRPSYVFSMEWAETCSKLRVGEFGGGAVIVTAKKVKWMATSTWISANYPAPKKATKGKV